MNSKVKARSGTFTDNMKLPIHRWFRYSAGFSAEWVESEIRRYETETGNTARLLDPFTGSGTTNLAASKAGRHSIGLEGHPFIAKVAQAKCLWHLDISELRNRAEEVFQLAQTSFQLTDRYNEDNLLTKCYSHDALSKLDSLKSAYETLKDDSSYWNLIWLCITSILRQCSGVGTAQWQYVLPNKTKSKVIDPFTAYKAKIEIILADMLHAQNNEWMNFSEIFNHDSRNHIELPQSNLVITSPPYPNNYDYADATRLEMMFWGEISGWGDLKNVVRPSIIRSCSQHSAADKISLEQILAEPILAPIVGELADVVWQLDEIRHTKGGKKTYHTMIAAYFFDIAKIWVNLRNALEPGSRVCFVVGDSAPYGIHVPAERWLADLALAAGFHNYHFEKLRDRNVKWKNRTHTVLLHEGRMWLEG